MLISISLRNFAIIDSISVNFKEGLNVITGDTGAGKSVIIDAINLIRGSKASPEYIRSGSEESHIEAVFNVKHESYIHDILNGYGIDVEDDLIIKRIISTSGKNKIIANGSNITLSMLTAITENLIDIFGQGENRDLLNINCHLNYLDDYGIDSSILQDIQNSYKKLQQIKSDIDEIEKKNIEKIQRQEFLRYQCDEIEKASLDINEEQELNSERKILANSELLDSNVSNCYLNLYERDNSICEELQEIADRINECARIDETLLEYSRPVNDCIASLKEIAYVLRDYRENISSDPSRLDEIQNRLNKINELKRKYNGDVSDIINKLRDYKKELEELDFLDDRLIDMHLEYESQLRIIDDLSKKLSHDRKKLASDFSSCIENELASLGIKNSRFKLKFEDVDYTSKGIDKVEFYFSSNPDEEIKPLVKIASGGELSRIMLVIKCLVSKNDNKSILIFDEPDSGIGGAVAEAMGSKIKNLSERHQVFCVTHLVQVAKFADHHITIKKEHVDNSTRVIASVLDDEQRVDELARMMSGIKITKKTIDAAREMITH